MVLSAAMGFGNIREQQGRPMKLEARAGRFLAFAITGYNLVGKGVIVQAIVYKIPLDPPFSKGEEVI